MKRYDSSRPVTAALAFPELSTKTGFANVLDVIGYNYKEHLYEADHARFPNKAILGSENGNNYKQWRAVLDHEYISGQFLWTGIDFLGETRGWPSHGSHAGLIDQAGFVKPIGFYRAALWSDQPICKLYARRLSLSTTSSTNKADDRRRLYDNSWSTDWAFPDCTEVEVICLTNAPAAELWLNGKSLGKKATVDSSDQTLTWSVVFKSGIIRAAGLRGTNSSIELSSDKLHSSGAPCTIRLITDTESLCAGELDMAHIIAEITDSFDRRVDNAEHLLNIEVTGGKLLGLENGDLEDTQPYALPYRRTKGGRLLIYAAAAESAGELAVRVWSEKLGEARLEIPCLA